MQYAQVRGSPDISICSNILRIAWYKSWDWVGIWSMGTYTTVLLSLCLTGSRTLQQDAFGGNQVGRRVKRRGGLISVCGLRMQRLVVVGKVYSQSLAVGHGQAVSSRLATHWHSWFVPCSQSRVWCGIADLPTGKFEAASRLDSQNVSSLHSALVQFSCILFLCKQSTCSAGSLCSAAPCTSFRLTWRTYQLGPSLVTEIVELVGPGVDSIVSSGGALQPLHHVTRN